MNYNFSKKWTLRILAAFFFLWGVAIIAAAIYQAQIGGEVPNGGRGTLYPFVYALISLIFAEFCKD